jgi:type IV pilus assembly protein PilA
MLSRLKMRDRKGFTLIELMIVVAIIGILAAIAIPNFLKFQAKAKQSEAKTNLKAIYTAETGYYGENNTYNTFDAVNWQPVGAYRYAYSLGADGGIKNPPGPGATLWFETGASAVHGDVSAAVTVTDNVFLAGAVGNIDSDADFDEWSINEQNILSIVKNDV